MDLFSLLVGIIGILLALWIYRKDKKLSWVMNTQLSELRDLNKEIIGRQQNIQNAILTIDKQIQKAVSEKASILDHAAQLQLSASITGAFWDSLNDKISTVSPSA